MLVCSVASRRRTVASLSLHRGLNRKANLGAPRNKEDRRSYRGGTEKRWDKGWTPWYELSDYPLLSACDSQGESLDCTIDSFLGEGIMTSKYCPPLAQSLVRL